MDHKKILTKEEVALVNWGFKTGIVFSIGVAILALTAHAIVKEGRKNRGLIK